MAQKIKFIDKLGNTPKEVHPYPAKKNLPNWYKSLEPYVDMRDGTVRSDDKGHNYTSASGKKCIPMFDAITAGYIIPTPTEIMVRMQNGRQLFQWPDTAVIDFHPPAQMSTHPRVSNDPDGGIPKFISPWGIQTPKGYSCLIIPPINGDTEIFRIIEGVVDTDSFNGVVHFPFWLDPTWEGTIAPGTPMAQVIPFKRDSYQMEIGQEDDNLIQASIRKLKLTFYNGYRDRFWNRKEYN
jgi:hypothetical protein